MFNYAPGEEDKVSHVRHSLKNVSAPEKQLPSVGGADVHPKTMDYVESAALKENKHGSSTSLGEMDIRFNKLRFVNGNALLILYRRRTTH